MSIFWRQKSTIPLKQSMVKSSGLDNYLNVNKFFLSIIGQWPYQLPAERILIRVLSHGLCTFILIPGLIALYDVRNESTIFVECIPPLFAVFLSYCYATFCSLNLSKIKFLTDSMKRDWDSIKSCKSELEIIEKTTQQGKNLTIIFIFYSYVSTLVYVMTPLLPQILDIILPLNESRERTYVFHVNYVFIENDNYYNFIYLHSVLAAFITLTNIVAVDFIFLASVQHACGIFQLLGYRLSNISDKNCVSKRGSIEERNINKRMVSCIELYNNILKFTDNIELSFSSMFFCIIGINMLMISFQGVQIVLNLDNPQILMRFGAFFMGQIIHLYFNSIPGQLLIDESSKVSQYCYDTNWTNMTIKSRKLLLFMLLRATRECKVSAGKVYVISTKNFSAVIKTSFSYLSVLSSAQ
ncbi:odorant receptor 49b-like [Leptopilina heterotoma]|uniref:odorant receptor 49b-like n=1 Tax=Leptopilina heterotoma TaxID=63436 RepID=UPI001CA7DFD4|nr:odorant receptor 49b-like [Leptopilina heterotoma]